MGIAIRFPIPAIETVLESASVLLSMTGFGEAQEQAGETHCRVEVRSVNNRHFKLNLRCPDAFSHMESEIERILRETISRGSVSLSLRFDRVSTSNAPNLNRDALIGYFRQLQSVCKELVIPTPSVGELLILPGVVEDSNFDADTAQVLWPMVEQAIRAAAAHMGEFRAREGASMGAELQAQCKIISAQVAVISDMVPQVSSEYRDKLLARVNETLKSMGTRLEPSDVLREVALFADRCDIHEEITRLRSHLEQFLKLLNDPVSQGRKLDFMCQEFFREVNTIGSKANHVGISHAAVEAKAAVERMREIVQNVE